MAILESAITINSATVPVALGSNQGRSQISIFNSGGGGTVYLGGSAVSIGTGIALASNGTPFLYPTPQGELIYAVTGAAGSIVRIIEF